MGGNRTQAAESAGGEAVIADLIPSAEIDPALVAAYVEWCCDCAECRCCGEDAARSGSGRRRDVTVP